MPFIKEKKAERPERKAIMKIKVDHVQNWQGEICWSAGHTRFRSKHFVYIGRKCYWFEASPLANPYKIGPDGNRKEVIAKYLADFNKWIRDSNCDQYKELKRLAELLEKNRMLVLVCWCSPLACHGDIIKGFLEEVFDDTGN